jgi:hypothetical protein
MAWFKEPDFKRSAKGIRSRAKDKNDVVLDFPFITCAKADPLNVECRP